MMILKNSKSFASRYSMLSHKILVLNATGIEEYMAHMLSLPEEILLDIFLRLAVMSLLPLRCVCKRLKTLLYSSKFVKMHLNYNVERNNICVMFKDVCSCERVGIYTVNSNALSSSLTTYDSCDKVVEVEHPVFPPDYECISILGSCDGLLCISACVSGHYDVEVTCIWNPSTGEYKKLPASFKYYPNERSSIYGFGYDAKINDYKLVKVRDFDGKRGRSKFNVYMLGSNSWKRFQPMPYWFRQIFPGVLVNEILHWLGVTRADNSSVIVSLDIGNEKFDEMSLPDEPLEAREAYKYVGALEGCLCLISNSVPHVDIWVMQEYRVIKSWNKRFRLTQEVFPVLTYFRPLCSFRNGEILFETNECLVLYNTQHNIVKKLKLCEDSHFPRIEWAENYVCSLILLKSNVYVERRKSTTKPAATWVV